VKVYGIPDGALRLSGAVAAIAAILWPFSHGLGATLFGCGAGELLAAWHRSAKKEGDLQPGGVSAAIAMLAVAYVTAVNAGTTLIEYGWSAGWALEWLALGLGLALVTRTIAGRACWFSGFAAFATVILPLLAAVLARVHADYPVPLASIIGPCLLLSGPRKRAAAPAQPPEGPD